MDSKRRSEAKTVLKIDAGPTCSCCPPCISLPSDTKVGLPNLPETNQIGPDGVPVRRDEAQLIRNATSLEAQSGDDIESSIAAIC